MNRTKNDLSADTAKLDFQAIRAVASMAYHKSKHEIERLLKELQHLDTGDPTVVSRYLLAQRLEESARDLAIAAETYTTVFGAMERKNLIIVNKPTVF
jgi:hypothetical protein